MAAQAVMVFPEPAGIMAGPAILAGFEGAPRWDKVDFAQQSVADLGETRVLSYRATGHRDGAEPYVALCSSTYARSGGAWVLLAHQQTPAG